MKTIRSETVHSHEEREGMLAAMSNVSRAFYSAAAAIGNHPFIEFCGLLNEYITICHAAHKQGIDFTQANTHTGQALPIESYNVAYLAEKLNCIYGPSLLASKALRDAFIAKLLDGRYRLVEVRGHARSEGKPSSV